MSESFEPEPSHWSEALGDILSWDEHARNYYGHITDRRYETLPEDHLALHSGLALAANRLLREKDQWHDSARAAEAELARVRPVVDAAEALVEYHEKPPPRLDRAATVAWLIPRECLISILAEKVKEAQR